MLRKIVLCGLVSAGCCFSTGSADAQVIWGGEPQRYFRPGAYAPNDGIPYQEQYGYDTNSTFLMFGTGNMNGNQVRNLDYWDRVARAYQFGYPVPASPYSYSPPSTTTYPRIGLGLGLFRRW